MENTILCWNCSVKTNVGYCHNCGVEIVDPNAPDVVEENEELEANSAYLNYLNTYNSDYYTAIYLLIGINLAFYVLTSIIGGSFLETGNTAIGLFGSSNSSISRGEYYVLLTSVFTHIGIFHLLFNMYALGIIAGRLAEYGYDNFGLLVTFVVIGILESLLTVYADTYSVTVGASGALLGWVGIYIAILRRENVSSWKTYMAFVVLYLLFSYLIPYVSFFGHLFGFVLGLLVGTIPLFDFLRKDNQ